MDDVSAALLLIFLGIGILWIICKVFSKLCEVATSGQREEEKHQANKALGDLCQYTINNLNRQYANFINSPEYRKGATRVITTEPISLYYDNVNSKCSHKFDLWKNEQFLCCISNMDFLISEICEYERIISSGQDEASYKKNVFNSTLNNYDGSNIRAFCIPLDHIEYFAKGGEKYTTQEIHGGGGTAGGFSLTGAIIGGAIAGDVGAIIGSRKEGKIAPITTETTIHDETFCFIKYRNNEGELREIVSDGSRIFYDALKELIPEKEYSYVISKPQVQTPVENTQTTQKSSEERLLSLKKLLDQGLISEDEYNQKRNKILDEI